MTEELKSALKEFFRNHKTRNEVYVSGGKLFYDRGAAESHSAGTVRYTRAEVEALPVTAGKEAGTEKPARKPAEKKKSATKAPAPEKKKPRRKARKVRTNPKRRNDACHTRE